MSKGKSNFRDRVNKDAEKQRSAASSYGYLLLPRGVGVWSPEVDSRVEFDVLPYEVTSETHPDRESGGATPGSLWFKLPYKIHRNVGPDNETVVCLSSIKKKCPVCEEYAILKRKEGVEQEELDLLRASSRNLYVVIPRGVKKVEEVPHILDISQYNFQDLLNKELKEHPEFGGFPDLEEGYTLRVRFDSKVIGKGQPFPVAGRIDFDERKDAIDEKIMDDVPNLDKVLNIYSYDKLKSLFLGISSDDTATGSDALAEEEKEEKKEERKAMSRRSSTPAREEKEEKKEAKEDVGYTWEFLEKKTMTGLVTLADKEGLRLRNVEDYEVDELREMIAKKLDIEIPKKKPSRKEREEEEEKPAKKSSKDKEEDECPHGFRFGVDTNKKEACDSCEVWDACIDAKRKKG